MKNKQAVLDKLNTIQLVNGLVTEELPLDHDDDISGWLRCHREIVGVLIADVINLIKSKEEEF